jgi:hypothetical protein
MTSSATPLLSTAFGLAIMHEPLTGIFMKSSKSKTGYQWEIAISATSTGSVIV